MLFVVLHIQPMSNFDLNLNIINILLRYLLDKPIICVDVFKFIGTKKFVIKSEVLDLYSIVNKNTS